MSIRSPFESMSRLPATARLLEQLSGNAQPVHAALSGLLGAARSLQAGALGLGRKVSGVPSSTILAVVDGPESALDVVADLRAFIAIDEAAHVAAKSPSKRTAVQKETERLAREDRWANEQRPATDSIPEELKNG